VVERGKPAKARGHHAEDVGAEHDEEPMRRTSGVRWDPEGTSEEHPDRGCNDAAAGQQDIAGKVDAVQSKIVFNQFKEEAKMNQQELEQ
jgi:hypothetical protein